ncbi:ATPase, T2SS/T4P/T4SS family [Bacillus sp. SM2101]|uniref:ATPase, T2SS/T4P/T4SS family n=1 Tax=Bacillus sp. SM2101 TaxID=2805366 RepID=UPI001BDF01EF|nr:ATPase, T2SS/T4P/T4SS family [Bacillus sp. SM2101]
MATYISPKERRTLDVRKLSVEINRKQGADQTRKSDQFNEFFSLCKDVKDHILSIYDKKIEENQNATTNENYVNLFHEAMIGVPSSVKFIKTHIESYISNHGFGDTPYPNYYLSLEDGVFEEKFGWGPLSVFKYQHNIEAAQVLGTDIKFKHKDGWRLQPFSFSDLIQVEEVVARFANTSSKNHLNKHTKPELETRTHEGFRVSIMIPERMHVLPLITLRRQTVKVHQLAKQVELGTIPVEATTLFKSLPKFKANGVIAGPPGCGKSSFLLTLLGEVLYEVNNGKKIPERINTIFGESSLEFAVNELFPKANINHVIGKGVEFEKVIPTSLLRHDVTRVVLQEIREHEVGLFQRSGIQGIKQILGTLHDKDPIDIPEILFSLYMMYYNSNVNPDQLYKMFARNIHYSITMDEFMQDEELVKKVTGVQFYDFDTRTFELKMVKIMHYDEDSDSWTFNSSIPERMQRICQKYDKQNYLTFTEKLKELEKLSPMPDVEKIQISAYTMAVS